MMENVNQQLSASLEDYLEAIYNIVVTSGVARSKEIADVLGVAKPSVTSALRSLAKRGLINYRPYGFVSLTESGQVLAATVVKKHDVISSFLADVLGVEQSMAQQAACQVEHSLGPEVITKLVRFVEFVTAGQSESTVVAGFKAFCNQ